MQMNQDFRTAITKALIVLAPSYAAAFLTEKMVYVVPTLAAAGFFASTMEASDRTSSNRLEEDLDESASESIESIDPD